MKKEHTLICVENRWNYWSTQEVLDLSTDWSAPLGDIVEGGTAPIHSDAHNGSK
jgi:hypothetical protein